MSKSILQKLKDIFSISSHKRNSFIVQSEHYTQDILTKQLTRDELQQLGQELIVMADNGYDLLVNDNSTIWMPSINIHTFSDSNITEKCVELKLNNELNCVMMNSEEAIKLAAKLILAAHKVNDAITGS